MDILKNEYMMHGGGEAREKLNKTESMMFDWLFGENTNKT
jgi:hypothetical protein